ncbi:CDP-glucose 4,6-dehydratase [Noviherbaspirillum massiliense]|uniref:CDP-glucose 4,6-dehydratase n=1 Tax=Noviherbaspirillum massiliense TaxID=1465823 RepID=UPI00031E1CCB|nr:CDP-glucose 4,6-dehydratase [Noviherbaspirillum massiliense]
MNPGFWSNKRVFITGHTGFKGSWLCLMLQSLGARVAGYALEPPTQPSLFSLARVGELVESTTADIRHLDMLCENMHAFRPDVVFHMAAQSVVLTSYEDPVDTYSTNVIGTVNTLEAVRRMRRPCVVVNVTTDKCYENKGWVWGYRECDTLGGRDPYSNSKACAELVGQSYRDSFFPPDRFGEHGVAIASARAGNVIGGGDWTARQLIPETIAAFVKAQPVMLRHPDAVRPWQHVLDCLAGYMRLAEALAEDAPGYAGEWNFGPADADSRPVSYIVESLAAEWGIEQPWKPDAAIHAPEERQLRLDVSKAANLLGWSSRLSLDEGLRWVAGWYRQYHRGADARALCRDQIAGYFERAGSRKP